MVFKYFQNIKNSHRGISLIEIVVVVFIIVLFSAILVANFPAIQRRLALSRATYKLAQDLRRAQDLGLSGVTIKDVDNQPVLVKGYGVFVDARIQPTEQYLIYADVNGDQKYSYGQNQVFCNQASQMEGTLNEDCIIELVDVSKENSYLFVENINNVDMSYTSVNFSPPDPIVNIENINIGYNEIGIVLALSSDKSSRTIWVNKSGLIRVQ